MNTPNGSNEVTGPLDGEEYTSSDKWQPAPIRRIRNKARERADETENTAHSETNVAPASPMKPPSVVLKSRVRIAGELWNKIQLENQNCDHKLHEAYS
jgi:hypothetical protein